MRMQGRKAVVFIMNLIIFVLLYFATLRFAPEILESIGITFLYLIFGNGVIFISFNTLDKFIKSKYFNKDLM